MKKNHGRRERRRLAKQNRLEANKNAARKKHFAEVKARNTGVELVKERSVQAQKPPVRKQNPKWFNRRKKVTMFRTWAKPQKTG